jgi:hypothetical protein
MRTAPRSLKTALLALFATLSGPAVFVCYAGPEPLVEIPTSATVGMESKQVLSDKNTVAEVQEPTKWWNIKMQDGYWSEYIFRGTNLTPDSDGITYQQLVLSGKGFTLGAWFATELSTAVVENATAVGEAGGGFSPFGGVFRGTRFRDVATQKRFQELDIFASYSHTFGPLDVTVGNVAFFIFRNSVDRFIGTAIAPGGVNSETDFAVPENEQFDRLFISLGTSKFRPFGIQITPTITYYQTIYNEADLTTHPNEVGPAPGESDEAYELRLLGFVRNDTLGGYLEGKVQAMIPIIGNTLRLQPTALISYSAGDRSEAVTVTPAQAGTKSSAEPLYGFNHFQGGAELILQLNKWLSVTGFGNWAHHIAQPTAGTERDEEWGGGYVTVSF